MASAPRPPRRVRRVRRGALPRAEVLMTLAALPVDDMAAYLRAVSATLTRVLRVDRADVLIHDPAAAALVSPGSAPSDTVTTPLTSSTSSPPQTTSTPAAPNTSSPPHTPSTAGPPQTTSPAPAGTAGILPLAEPSPLVQVFHSGRPYLAVDSGDAAAALPGAAGRGARSLLAVPLSAAGRTRGVLYVTSPWRGAFTAADRALLTVVATRVGLLLENAELARRRAELEQERSRQQARQEFVGLVSHELKTPVAVITAYTEALQQRAERDGDAEGRRILDRVAEQARRMLGLIDDLLDLQRLHGGLLPLEQSRVDLGELARRVVEALQATAPAHRLVVQSEPAVVARADRRRIEQVLTNLVENAITYSPAGGVVSVTVRAAPLPLPAPATGVPPGGVLLAVSDQGIGIAPEDLPRIFERFYQAEGGRLHRGVRGLGLGLYLAREIVERHGGALWAESTPGHGATFYLALPVTPSSAPADPFLHPG